MRGREALSQAEPRGLGVPVTRHRVLRQHGADPPRRRLESLPGVARDEAPLRPAHSPRLARLAPHGPSRALGHSPPSCGDRPREGQVPLARVQVRPGGVFERVFFLRAEFCLLRLPDSAVPGLLGDTQSGAGLSEPVSASAPVAAPPAEPLRVTKEPCGDVLLLFSEIRNVFRSFPVIRCCLLCHLYLMTDSSLKEIAVYPQIFDSFYLKNTLKRKTFSFQEAQTLAGVRVT